MDLMPMRPLDDAAGEARPEPVAEGASPGEYRGPDMKCYLCESFEDPGRCAKGVNGGEVDPEGSCGQFSAATEDDEAGDYVGDEEGGF